ncbi:MAG: molybdenum cofactor biosynthesis protein MoaE, partial [SAR202 cluster bacterium]|nr:molybdenum cofactor biosynthesis protein MoaE [SAR202 cluster bacterium]
MSKKISYETFITHNELNIEELSAEVIEDRNGAVVVFNGITRDHTGGRKVLFLEYEAYLPRAKAKLNDVAKEMCDKWDVSVVIAHRIGRVDIGESSLIVSVGSPHRASAYQASQYSVDRIKQIVPIWKKEHFDG